MTAPERKIPAFYKVYIPELCSLKMGKLIATTAFLRNSRGSVWAVGVIREGRDLYFEKGWVRFVKDNNVEMGDILVFQFSGDYFFDFKHLGKSCCKKEIVGSFKFTVKPEEIEAEIEDNEGGEKHNNPWTDEEEDAYDDEAEEYDDDEEEEEEEEDDDDEEEEYDDEDSEVFEEEEEENDDDEYSVEEEFSAGNKGKAVGEDEAGSKKNVNGKGVGDIFKSGLIKPPRNPYFVAQPSKRCELHIPRNVIIDQKLKIPDEIIVTSTDGWEFVARIKTWGDGRTVIIDGWSAFCARYQVKKDDLCLCEFVPPQNQKLLLRALHFQAGKWISMP